MYGTNGRSLGPKFLLTTVHAGSVLAVVWLLLFHGQNVLEGWFGTTALQGNFTRRVLLVACSVIYFLRLCFTLFYLMRRKVAWSEALILVVWLPSIHLTFAYLGGMNAGATDLITDLGIALYLIGSYLNTGSELQRHLWKQRVENRGHLFTQGLFRYAQHINYFGDVVLFTGFAVITGRILALIIPGIMAAGFVFGHISVLDRYLRRKYGSEFEQYTRRTKKFVPFLY